MYRLIRPLLFSLEPEAAHRLTLALLCLAGGLPPARLLLQQLYAALGKPVRAFGLTFKNPLGLAAGYDKDCLAVSGLAALGFGHVEIGTVTPLPQPGNPPPRLFRLVEDQGTINRLGFPSQGAAIVARRLQRESARNPGLIIGVNLGKNQATPLDEAARDYVALMAHFAALADYLVINVSSPNTEGLRRLEGRQMLNALLVEVNEARRSLATQQAGNAPVLVKLSPDLDEAELADAVGVSLDRGMDGIIATNTTLSREALRSRWRGEAGGLSGLPLRARSERALQRIVQVVRGRIPIVSVGGITTPEDARRRLDMGAALVQIYTGLVFHGPGLARRMLQEL